MIPKAYLGDGVYVECEEGGDGMLWLTTEDGISTTNIIYQEPEVLQALFNYVKAAKEAK